MDFHQLAIFIEVVEHKSFTKAAEEIFLSQSTVSSHIQALEKQLNLKLFDRDGRDITLTKHGEDLYVWAQKLLHLRDEALLDLKSETNDFKGTLKIAASSVPSSYILPKLISHFLKEYPNVTFRLMDHPSKTVTEMVLKGGAEIGIVGEKYENDKLVYIPVLKEKLVIITPKNVELPKHYSTLEDCLMYPFIFRDSDSGTLSTIKQYFKKKKIPCDLMQTPVYTSSGSSLMELVKEGVGISIVSEITALEYAKQGVIHMYDILDFDQERSFYLCHRKNRTLSIPARFFITQAPMIIEQLFKKESSQTF